MDSHFLGIAILEWTGYIASAIILVSYLMKNVTKLRIIGTVGCIFFVIYGSLIPSWPIVITNGVIVIINLYYLLIVKDKKS